MSERARLRRGGTALVLLLVLGAATGARAQTSRAEAIERLHARAAQLDAALPAARAAADRADSARDARRRAERDAGTDSLRVGPLLVLTRTEQADLAAGIMADAWAAMAPSIGDADTLFRRETFVFDHSARPGFSPVVEGRRRRILISTVHPRETVVRAARRAIGDALTAALPEDFRRWMGFRTIVGTVAAADAYRDLVTAPSKSVRRCFAGDRGECWIALGAVPIEDPLRRWYEPADLRHLALIAHARPGRLRAERRACAEGLDAACYHVVAAASEVPSPPLSGATRAGLVQHALDLGGDGAYARLLAADGPPRDRIAAAAGRPADEVLDSWLARVLSAKPARAGAPGRDGPAALLGLLVLGGLALRSTRWRLR